MKTRAEILQAVRADYGTIERMIGTFIEMPPGRAESFRVFLADVKHALSGVANSCMCRVNFGPMGHKDCYEVRTSSARDGTTLGAVEIATETMLAAAAGDEKARRTMLDGLSEACRYAHKLYVDRLTTGASIALRLMGVE